MERSRSATAQEDVEVSLVMPCLNESRTLKACLTKALQGIAAHGLRAEVIVADNGSQDGSQRIAHEAGARVVHVNERGYGAALRGGIEAARGRYVIIGDADDSYDWSAVHGFIERLREGDDLVMGCRLPAGGGRIMPGAMTWQNRWIGNPALSAIGRLFFRAPVTDFHCGLRGFQKDVYDELDLRATGMEFASEMVIKATLRGKRISEIPVTLYPDGRGGRSHLNRWRDGWRHLRFMLLFCPRWLFLIPGITLFVAGLLLGVRLLIGPLQIGRVEFNTNTLLVCSVAILIGFQLATFAAFSKVFATTAGLLAREERWIRPLTHGHSLEFGLLIGLLVMMVGFGLLIWSLDVWRRAGFGELSYPAGLRMVIPAVTTLTLGVQIIIGSFFLSVLTLPRQERDKTPE